jgi:aldose sugar dehydrogenase
MMFKFFLVVVLIIGYFSLSFTAISGSRTSKYPILQDLNLRAEIVYSGIKFPTSMAFLGANDILVLEKNEGVIKRIVNGTIIDRPLLDLNVATNNERGMLGIAVGRNINHTYIFVYLTESTTKDGEETRELLHGRLYRYELINDILMNPKLLIDIPFRADGIPQHYGGKLLTGFDSSIYLIIGDYGSQRTETQNFDRIGISNGSSVIYKVSYDGNSVDSILSPDKPFNKYYAYGIRNSFGMDFDPITGKLWDTENGNSFGDEINLVEPGFNSGWAKIQGFWEVLDPRLRHSPNLENIIPKPDGLFGFDGKGNYSSPEFTWVQSVGVTALKFLDSEKYGTQYKDDLFVGDFNNGNLYHFELNENRTALKLQGPLSDKIANSANDLKGIIFGRHFWGITDIKVGPDGYLYVLSLYEGADDCVYQDTPKVNECINYNPGIEGTIFKILPID